MTVVELMEVLDKLPPTIVVKMGIDDELDLEGVETRWVDDGVVILIS